MKKLKIPLAIIMSIIMITTFVSCDSSDSSADTIITNANIYTVDKDRTVAEAVAVKNDEIIYVGDAEGAKEFEGNKTNVIDGKGGTVIPGMVDSHMHPATSAVMYYYEIALPEDVLSEAEYLKIIKEFVAENPDREVYSGSGFMRSLFDQVGPRKEKLDEISKDKPIMITSADGHSMWVNSKTMELAGITKDTKNPENGVIQKDPKTGEPAGLLQESAMDLVADLKPEYSAKEYKEALTWLQEWFNSVGITTIFDALVPTDNDEYSKSYQQMAENEELTLRVRGAWHMHPDMGTKEEMLNIVKKNVEKSKSFKTDFFKIHAFKFFADQVLEEETAYLSEPYSNRDDNWKGLKVWDNDIAEALFTEIDKNEFQIHTHQIGDAAATYILDVLEKVKEVNGERDSRHSFAHVQMLKEKDKDRIADLKMNAIIAPYWSVIDDYYWDLYTPYLGKERVNNMYPAKSLIDRGINVPFHSDFFVTDPDPGWEFYSAQTRTLPERIFNAWYGDDSGITRTTDYDVKLKKDEAGPLPQKDERMSLEESIYSATYAGAYANFMEDEVGSIEVGKKADLVLYTDNLFELDIEGIADIVPALTLFNGKIVYDKNTAKDDKK